MDGICSEYKDDKYVGSFNFTVDEDKCTGCGLCVKTCSTTILYKDDDGRIKMRDGADGIFGWGGCYRCQHCLAVCPEGAISIFGKKPEDSVSPKDAASPHQLEALMRSRRACRGYLDREIPRAEIDDMLKVLANVPTGSNRQSIEFSVMYEKAQTDKFRKLVRDEALRLAEQGIYPGNFTKKDFELQAAMEPFRNPGDMFFVNAPHLLVIHSPQGMGTWSVDPILAAAWFDLICASRGYGCIIMTYPVGALSKMPEVRALLQIPEGRHFACILGFGYPEVKYARGVQREDNVAVHEIKLP